MPDVTDLARLTSTDGAPHDTPLDYSPDGKMLVFYRAIRAEPDFPIDIGGSLWVVNVDGTGARQLDTPPPNWWARWAPDGTSILFVSERNQSTGAVWTIQPDGSGLTRVFEDPSGRFPIDPVWSPDGRQIMFMLDPISDRFDHPEERHLRNALRWNQPHEADRHARLQEFPGMVVPVGPDLAAPGSERKRRHNG